MRTKKDRSLAAKKGWRLRKKRDAEFERQHKITPLPEQSWKPAGPNPELSPNALFDDLTFIEDGPAPSNG